MGRLWGCVVVASCIFSAVLGFHGTFLQITDVHLDLKYAVNSSVQATSCHALTGTAEPLGERFFCDSPEDLVDRTFKYISDSTSADFILLTGDFARHDDYAPLPRTWQEIVDENTKVIQKLARLFPGIPIIPSIGNNDVFPHDNLDPPGPNNTILVGLAAAWAPILDGAQRQAMLQGGWLLKRVGNSVVVSLNTIYLAYGQDCSQQAPSPSLIQMEWLSAVLSNAQSAGNSVLISGHVPPHMWNPSCRAIYANMCVNYASTIKGQIFAHLHSDEFHFVNTDGTVDSNQTSPNTTIAINCAPSIVPNFNPSFRVWQYDTGSMDILDYTQYYADIEQLNHGQNFKFQKEYSLLEAYQIQGSPSHTEFWLRLNDKLHSDIRLGLRYEMFKYVSAGHFARPLNSVVCKKRPYLCK